MRNRLKCSIFLIILLIICNVHPTKTYAVSNNSNKFFTYMGDYGCSEPVNKETKVYIEENIVDFIESTGREVMKETSSWWIFSNTQYYYIANEYVEKVVYIRQISNDIDSLIFMVKELESMAKKYDESNYKNLVLGYIRSINKKYSDDGYSGNWKLLAGDTPIDFIKFVEEDNSHGLKLNDYFGSFIGQNLYNIGEHDEMLEKYKTNTLNLIDFQGNNIDLIHMFASMDGIYKKTDGSLYLGNNLQRDILSWNGDLQQACKSLNSIEKENTIDYDELDMNYLFTDELHCTKEDVIADIDAMNITKMYIDNDMNSISNSLSAYYKLIDENINNRFDLFIKTVTLDKEDGSDSRSIIEEFEHEVYFEFNLIEGITDICDSINYDPILPVHDLMKDNNGLIPSFKIRKYVTQSFIKYIEYNSSMSI